MNPAIYFLYFFAIMVPIILLYVQENKRRKIIARIIRKKRGIVIMSDELLSEFIGKKCIIKSAETITGDIKNIQDNWMEIETKQGKELLNIDFIERIQEYPINKKR